MTHFTTSKGEFIAVPVPEGSFDFEFVNTRSKELWYTLEFEVNSNVIFKQHSIDLEQSTLSRCEIIGLSSDILKNEELAKKVVNEIGSLFGYSNSKDKFLLYSSAITAFKSLLDLHGIEGNQLIIKKLN